MAALHPAAPHRRTLLWTLGGAAVGVGSATGLAVWVSQFHPIFGSVFERIPDMEPFGEVRMGLLPIHLFIFGLAGIALGAALGAALSLLFAPAPPPVIRARGRTLAEPPIVWPGEGREMGASRSSGRNDFAFLDGE